MDEFSDKQLKRIFRGISWNKKIWNSAGGILREVSKDILESFREISGDEIKVDTLKKMLKESLEERLNETLWKFSVKS